jgi:hypothetical protein
MFEYLKQKHSGKSIGDLLLIVLEEFYFLNLKIDRIMGTQKEAADILEAMVPQIGVIKAAVIALETAAANQDQASPELSQAVTDVKAAFQDLSDTVAPPAAAPAPVTDPAAPDAPADPAAATS